MDLKKSPKADSNSKRIVYLAGGLILALLVVGLIFVLRAVVVPYFDTPEEHRIERLDNVETVAEEQIVGITHQDQKSLEAPNKLEEAAMANVRSIVMNAAKVTTDVDILDFEEDPDVVLSVNVKEQPTFQGGDLGTFRDWVQKNVRYPQIARDNGISGIVILNFVIERDGRLTNIKVCYTPDKSLSDEAIRVVKQSPKWTPGRQDGKTVRVSYYLPVKFRIQQ